MAVREQLQMTLSPRLWLRCDPSGDCAVQEGVPQQVRTALRRRAYLIEKARTANIVGTRCPLSSHQGPGLRFYQNFSRNGSKMPTVVCFRDPLEFYVSTAA